MTGLIFYGLKSKGVGSGRLCWRMLKKNIRLEEIQRLSLGGLSMLGNLSRELKRL
jgi:hypothetical protein